MRPSTLPGLATAQKNAHVAAAIRVPYGCALLAKPAWRTRFPMLDSTE